MLGCITPRLRRGQELRKTAHQGATSSRITAQSHEEPAQGIQQPLAAGAVCRWVAGRAEHAEQQLDDVRTPGELTQLVHADGGELCEGTALELFVAGAQLLHQRPQSSARRRSARAPSGSVAPAAAADGWHGGDGSADGAEALAAVAWWQLLRRRQLHWLSISTRTDDTATATSTATLQCSANGEHSLSNGSTATGVQRQFVKQCRRVAIPKDRCQCLAVLGSKPLEQMSSTLDHFGVRIHLSGRRQYVQQNKEAAPGNKRRHSCALLLGEGALQGHQRFGADHGELATAQDEHREDNGHCLMSHLVDAIQSCMAGCSRDVANLRAESRKDVLHLSFSWSLRKQHTGCLCIRTMACDNTAILQDL
mmetsp:Transcript_164969/g.529569  ORF Transcript_164969/g.529569 Transcript_164969/m.529569 type:complete len:365 (+) Transcript_164969:900-1994(+)